MREPQGRSQKQDQSGKKSVLKLDQVTQLASRDLLLNTGLILGQQDDVISLIQRLDTSAFDDDDEAEEILVDTPLTNNNLRARQPQVDERLVDTIGLRTQ